jgi:type II secretory pathway pseudopilin PulG
MDTDAVIRLRVRSLHRGQSGLSAVEMIITMALTGIVLGAIFSVYLLLYRVQTTWQEKSQARATGLVAEGSLQRDLERYQVTTRGSNTLVLNAAPGSGTTFSVTYVKDSSNRMVRTVTQGSLTTKSIVAHGIRAFETWCRGDTAPVLGGSPGLWVDPPLTVTLRNDTTCNALSVAMRVDTQ